MLTVAHQLEEAEMLRHHFARAGHPAPRRPTPPFQGSFGPGEESRRAASSSLRGEAKQSRASRREVEWVVSIARLRLAMTVNSRDNAPHLGRKPWISASQARPSSSPAARAASGVGWCWNSPAKGGQRHQRLARHGYRPAQVADDGKSMGRCRRRSSRCGPTSPAVPVSMVKGSPANDRFGPVDVPSIMPAASPLSRRSRICPRIRASGNSRSMPTASSTAPRPFCR